MLKRLKSGSNTNSTEFNEDNGSTVHDDSANVISTDTVTQKTASLESKLRESMEQNEKMEDLIRSIAKTAKIVETDIDKMDITEISTKLIEYVSAAGAAPVQRPIDIEDVNSLVIDEVFDELDEYERKYEERDTMHYAMGQTAKDIDDEFEDDVPPKKVYIDCVITWCH